MKKCKECNQSKNTCEFAKNPSSKDGYRNFCKICVSEKTVKSGYKRQNNKKMPVRYRYGKNEAKRKGRVWELSLEEHTELVLKPCHYCGGKLPETGCGLDRIDSSIGYVIGNVNPCCTVCNIMKSSLSLSEFYEHIEKILAYKE